MEVGFEPTFACMDCVWFLERTELQTRDAFAPELHSGEGPTLGLHRVSNPAGGESGSYTLQLVCVD